MRSDLFLYLAKVGLAGAIARNDVSTSAGSLVIPVNKMVSASAAPPVLQPYMSYSIEFCYFPDYAGVWTVMYFL